MGLGRRRGEEGEETPTSTLVGVEVSGRKLNFKLCTRSLKFSFLAGN